MFATNSGESGFTPEPKVDTTSPLLDNKYLLKFHDGLTPLSWINFLYI